MKQYWWHDTLQYKVSKITPESGCLSFSVDSDTIKCFVQLFKNCALMSTYMWVLQKMELNQSNNLPTELVQKSS